jgi:hypothetical protein
MIGCGCLGGGGLPDNPPDYVDSLYTSAAGPDGMTAYFILADENGQMTTANGYMVLEVKDEDGRAYSRRSGNVTADQFTKAKIGMGAFEREAILFNIGRWTFPGGSPSGRVTSTLTFTTEDGRELTATDTTYYD